MCKKLLSLFAASALTLGWAAGNASAETMELMSPTGTDSGWSATWNSALVPQPDLIYKGTAGGDFFIENDATFNSGDLSGLTITFQKTGTTADTLVINDAAIDNESGAAWNGFAFALDSTSGGSPGFAFTNSDGSSSSTLSSFDINPFTSFAFQDQNSVLSMSGGTINNGDTWMPGATSQEGLAIVASGDTVDSFNLVETPNVVPLPAAAWSGLSLLAGLALARAQRVRRLAD